MNSLLVPVLEALGATLHGEIPGGMDWKEVVLSRLHASCWIDGEGNPSSPSCSALIIAEIQLALEEEGFSGFCVTSSNQVGMKLVMADGAIINQAIKGEGLTPLDAWLNLYAKYKGIEVENA